MKTERWLPVVGYEDSYEVSDGGRVRSLPRLDSEGKRLAGRVLKPGRATKGHRTVALCRDGKPRSRLVHVLVLEAFRGARPEGFFGCHDNGDPGDNRLDNLFWKTPQQNSLDMLRHGTSHWANKTHCPSKHEYTPENTITGSYIAADGTRKSSRVCRKCKAARERARRARTRAGD